MSSNGKAQRKLDRKNARARVKSAKKKKAPTFEPGLAGVMKLYRSFPKTTQKYVRWGTIWGATVLILVVFSILYGDTGAELN